MIKKLILILSIPLLLGSSTLSTASRVAINGELKAVELSSISRLIDIGLQALLVAKDGRYYESNASDSRSGTENWEEPQNSFFVLPGVILGIIAVILFFNRTK